MPARIEGATRDVNAVVARALSFDPAARPADACEVQAAIGLA
ncbi:MAG: hypothetical protein PGN34_26500 [Methylobacterium frigidaeris]